MINLKQYCLLCSYKYHVLERTCQIGFINIGIPKSEPKGDSWRGEVKTCPLRPFLTL